MRPRGCRPVRAGRKSYRSGAARRRRRAKPRRSHPALPATYQSSASRTYLARFSLRLLEQLLRMDNGAGRDRLTAEHPRDLGNAFLVLVETADTRTRVSAGVFFPDVEMRRAEAGDLRK